mgnify:CR=1 FL=1
MQERPRIGLGAEPRAPLSGVEHPDVTDIRPLQHGIPDDLQQRLLDAPPAQGRFEQVLQLSYWGEGGLEPDFARIAAALGGAVRLLHGGIDRIQGHPQGQLVLALEGHAAREDWGFVTHGPGAVAHAVKGLGYVV